jgi:lipopolysaccharide export system protein LptA
VVVTKGTIVMRGARLEVRQDGEGYQSGVMFGAPGKRAFFRQKREGVNEFIEGEADSIEYDGKTDIVRFVRRAEMRRLAGTTLQDQVTGDVIVYNNRTEVYTVDGAPTRPAHPPATAACARCWRRATRPASRRRRPAAAARPAPAAHRGRAVKLATRRPGRRRPQPPGGARAAQELRRAAWCKTCRWT